jgi:hypothetical protein
LSVAPPIISPDLVPPNVDSSTPAPLSATLNGHSSSVEPSQSHIAIAPVTNPNHPAIPAAPANASEWFKLGFAELTKIDLGPSFHKVLRAFIEIESLADFADQKKGFSRAGRPEELGKWIAAGRWRRSPPVVTDVQAFAKSWWSWWDGLQPKWREGRQSSDMSVGVYGDDWGVLKVPGPNGWLSVVACLYWWGCATSDSAPHLLRDYEEGVRDVIFMMDGLLLHLKAESG